MLCYAMLCCLFLCVSRSQNHTKPSRSTDLIQPKVEVNSLRARRWKIAERRWNHPTERILCGLVIGYLSPMTQQYVKVKIYNFYTTDSKRELHLSFLLRSIMFKSSLFPAFDKLLGAVARVAINLPSKWKSIHVPLDTAVAACLPLNLLSLTLKVGPSQF